MTATTPAMSAMACAICTNISGNRSHAAREMMFGWRDSFTYLECAACGCLQNVSVPRDLGRYYGTDYYSVAPHRPRRRLFYDAIKATRTRAHLQGLQGSGIIGRNLLKRFGPPGLPKWVARCGLRQDSNILEVGCGSGALLLSMRSEGFTRLAGADPFIESDIDHGCGLVVRRAHIADGDSITWVRFG